jgi:transposase
MEKVRYLMTKKELVRVFVIKSLVDDKMTSRDAAEVLNLSERQIKRLKAGVKKDGEVFVIHKNRGRKPKHTIPGEIREEIVFLAKRRFGVRLHKFTFLFYFRFIFCEVVKPDPQLSLNPRFRVDIHRQVRGYLL